MAATASMTAAAVTKSAPSVKSPMEPTGGAAARGASPAKIAIVTENAMVVMPEHITIRPPETPIVVQAIIIAIIRPIPTRPTVAVVTGTCATCQNPEQHQAYSQPPSVA